jgi:hypothetical protein
MAMNQAIEYAKSLWRSAKALWHDLPHQVQAVLILFGSTVTTAIGDAAATAGTGFWHWAALKHTLGAAVGAGIVAVRAFYLRPGPGIKAARFVEISEPYSSS